MNPLFLTVCVSILGLATTVLLALYVKSKKEGPREMVKIASFIREGADAFLAREIKTIAVFAVIIAIALWYAIGARTAISFLLGATLSTLAAYIGMKVSTLANVRVAAAALKKKEDAAIIAYRGGAVTGLAIVSMSLLGIAVLYSIFNDPVPLAGFGFGASLAALFLQLGGGIYTKAADVGADLVGKVEAGIPEDDPRNPAVIADLVGDNVGDCAGRGTDLFESFSDEIIATMILALSFVSIFGEKAIFYPLLVQSIGVIATIIGIAFLRRYKDPVKTIYLSFGVAGIAVLIGLYYLATSYMNSLLFFYASAMGLIVSLVVALMVLYYTDPRFKPTREIGNASKMGAGINLITGFAYGLESAVPPVLFIAVVLLAVYNMFGGGIEGIYGIAAASLGILSTTGIIMAADTFGPIADNADGIGDMSGYGDEVGEVTDKLDRVGNTTKATTKGYAMACALMTSIVMLFAYFRELAAHRGVEISQILVNLAEPQSIIATFIGATLPFLFSAFAIKAVGRAAFKIVEEVRRQWKERPQIMKGKAKPDYARCVDIATKAALKEMIAPTLIALALPIIVGIALGPTSLAAYLIAVNLTAPLLALFMYNGGGAWDNAKKFVKETMGKGKEYKAAVIGDTLGDPLKDTAGPSLHILLKLQNIVAITLLPLFLLF